MKRESNPLKDYFDNNEKNLINKWLHYLDIYHMYLKKFRKKEVTVLEFGVSHGGSLQMWKKYFGRKARIIGIDIFDECKKLEEKQIEIYIGDQEDRKFLKSLMKKIGPVDVVIEDGGHEMKQQIHTFEEVFPYVKEGGIYVAEDLHTSYWEEFGGSYRKSDTFIEYLKGLIDEVNAYHSRDKKKHKITSMTDSILGIHIYDSMAVFEKGVVTPPSKKKTGNKSVNQ